MSNPMKQSDLLFSRAQIETRRLDHRDTPELVYM